MDRSKIEFAQLDDLDDRWISRSNHSETLHHLSSLDAVNVRLGDLHERGFTISETGHRARWDGEEVYVCYVASQSRQT